MKTVLFLVVLSVCSFGGIHNGMRGSQVHTPFRWVFENDVERSLQSVSTSDTDKVAYQKSDSSIWILRGNSPVTWINLNKTHGTLFADSLDIDYGIRIGSASISGVTGEANLSGATITGAATIQNVDANIIVVDTLIINNEGSFYHKAIECSLFVEDTLKGTETGYITETGNMMNLSIPGTFTINKLGSGSVYLKIADAYKPYLYGLNVTSWIYDKGDLVVGVMQTIPQGFKLLASPAVETGIGTCGVRGLCITYPQY